jgi:hypothetical protein
MHAIGIDMSKRSFHAAFDDATVYPFPNSESGIEKFLDDLAGRGIASETQPSASKRQAHTT